MQVSGLTLTLPHARCICTWEGARRGVGMCMCLFRWSIDTHEIKIIDQKEIRMSIYDRVKVSVYEQVGRYVDTYEDTQPCEWHATAKFKVRRRTGGKTRASTNRDSGRA